jgi:hypothetical protein
MYTLFYLTNKKIKKRESQIITDEIHCDQIKEFVLPTARDYNLVSIKEAKVDSK